MADEIPNDANHAGEDKKKAEAITIRVKDQVQSTTRGILYLLSVSCASTCHVLMRRTCLSA